MAKISRDEYSIFDLNTSNIKYMNELEQLVPIAGTTLSNLSKIVTALERNVRSATGEQDFTINRSLIKVNPETEIGSFRIVVEKQFEKIVKEVIRNFEGKSRLVGDSDYPLSSAMQVSKGVKIEYNTSAVHGTTAQNEMLREADKAGGYAEVLGTIGKNKENMKAVLFATEAELANSSVNALYRETFPNTIKKSNAEMRKRKLEEQEQVDKEVQKYFADEKIAESKARKKELQDAEKEEKRQRKLEDNWKKVEMNSKKKEKSEEDEEKKSKKEDGVLEPSQLSGRQILGKIGIGITILSTIASIARRILTNMVKTVREASSDAVSSQTMGLSYSALRRYRLFEKAKNIKEDSSYRAIQTLQSKFGLQDKLDPEATKDISMIGGKEVEDFVRLSDRGDYWSEELFIKLLDSAYGKYNSGIDSFDRKVGKAKAGAELTERLKSISPDLAAMFEAWISDSASGINKGRDISTFEKWQNSVNVMQAGFGDEALYTEVGKALSEFGATLDSINQGVLISFTNGLAKAIDKLNNLKLGTDADDRVKINAENRSLNAKASRKYKALQEASETQLTDYLATNYGLEDLPDMLDPNNAGFYADALYNKKDVELLYLIAARNVAKAKHRMAQKEVDRSPTEDIDYNELQLSSEQYEKDVVSATATMVSNIEALLNHAQGQTYTSGIDANGNPITATFEFGTLASLLKGKGAYSNPVLQSIIKSALTTYSDMDFLSNQGDFVTKIAGYMGYKVNSNNAVKKEKAWESFYKDAKEANADNSTLFGDNEEWNNKVYQAFVKYYRGHRQELENAYYEAELAKKSKELAGDAYVQSEVIDTVLENIKGAKSLGAGESYDLSKVSYSVANGSLNITIPVTINGKQASTINLQENLPKLAGTDSKEKTVNLSETVINAAVTE